MQEETLVKYLIRYKDVLEGMLTAMVGDSHAAEDLFQDTAVILTRKREEVPEDCPFLAWSRAVAFNVACDYRKKTTRRKVVFLDTEALDALGKAFQELDPASWDSRSEALRQCADTLPERQREILRLKYEKNFSVDDVAASLSTSRGAVDTMLYRIRQALTRCVEGRLGYGGIT
jgi:RNA polymerase sigma-70 factor (ECF subfamily)